MFGETKLKAHLIHQRDVPNVPTASISHPAPIPASLPLVLYASPPLHRASPSRTPRQISLLPFS
ncbi:hypothetical protein E2C01_092106 [Portunus trituberculatus]|uniref:Uncharacterized protein n=1 Tax=Portunus trituberculatus TaxID=210409 RepID=A0A5B7JUL3_PORTR|nr:hypothetical protein [Portunus trituberculatus]